MAKTFIQRSREKGAAEKAAYHTVSGAGKSRTKREFFGLNQQDEEQIARVVSKHLDKLVRR